MRILICSPEYNDATGNWVTATRYRHGLEKFGHRVTLCYLPPDFSVLEQVIADVQPEVLLLVHAYRTGKQWLQVRERWPVPTVVMLSGTDVNEGLLDVEQSLVIKQVLDQADAVVAQNQLLIDQFKLSHSELSAQLYFVPPSIELGTDSYQLRKLHGIAEHAVLFLCPAGLRPVKGLVELLELFDQLSVDSGKWQLAFCGPILDEDYAQRFLAAVTVRAWVHYLGVIAPKAMAAVLRQADVILNNSYSEGLPNSLLEAASLGKPILARDIVGNRPIVEHGVNGLLYQDNSSFVTAAQSLITDAALRTRLAQSRAERYHPDQEAKALNAVFTQVALSIKSITKVGS